MNISRPSPIPPTFTRGSLRRRSTEATPREESSGRTLSRFLLTEWAPSSEWLFSLADQFSDRQHRDWKMRRRTMKCGRLAGVLLSGMTMDQWYHRIFSQSFFKTVTKKGWCYKDDDCSSWFFLVNIGFCKKSPRNGVRHPSCDSSSSGLVVNFRPDDLQQWYRLRSQDCAWSDPDTPEDPLW